MVSNLDDRSLFHIEVPSVAGDPIKHEMSTNKAHCDMSQDQDPSHIQNASLLDDSQSELMPLRLTPLLHLWVPLKLIPLIQYCWEKAQSLPLGQSALSYLQMLNPDYDDPTPSTSSLINSTSTSFSSKVQDITMAHLLCLWSVLSKLFLDTPAQSALPSPSYSLFPSSEPTLHGWSPRLMSFSITTHHYLLQLCATQLQQLLNGNDIHVITKLLSSVQQSQVINVYYSLLAQLKALPSSDTTSLPSMCQGPAGNPALLKLVNQQRAVLFPIFGGQGPHWLTELYHLYQTYPMIRPFLEAAHTVLEQDSQSCPFAHFYRPQSSLSILPWLLDINTWPDETYLASSPVSSPLIFLTQLAQYWLTCMLWRLKPQQVASYFVGTSGHSQGLITAILISAVKTIQELEQRGLACLQWMMWIGIRVTQHWPYVASDSWHQQSQGRSHYAGTPTPMLNVSQLEAPLLQQYIDMINMRLGPHATMRTIELGLRNGPRQYVVVGHQESLNQLVMVLDRAESPPGDTVQADQNQLPPSKRKHPFNCRYLNVSVPYHSSHLQHAIADILQDAVRFSIQFHPNELHIPVYVHPLVSKINATSVNQGHLNLQQLADSNILLETVVKFQIMTPIDWVNTLQQSIINLQVTHIIDFGPGEYHGIGSISSRNLHGSGVQVILATCFANQDTPHAAPGISTSYTLCLTKSTLFDIHEENIPFGVNWHKLFGPKLLRISSSHDRSHISHQSKLDAINPTQLYNPTFGDLVVDTKFTRFFGRPPLMVGGMTPTSIHPELVAAIVNSGFLGELAGGGLPTTCLFRNAIHSLAHLTAPGHGLALNLLFLNPSQWAKQYPLALQLRREGYPLSGLTIAAGVPSLEKAKEILNELQEAGFQYVSFKPSSIASILAVVEIAHAVPDFTVLLQWTGGRGGGHHSYEDFHGPILTTYSQIREAPNVVLVAGSGFGDWEHSWPYLEGTWSMSFGYPRMPFDAVMIASRVMVAKEAKTVRPVKELLISTPGITKEQEWELSYQKPVGGVITVLSELGQPIHKVATRGILLWKHLDQEYFSLPMEKRTVKILERKAQLIQRINTDFQKVYFGQKFDGQVADLEQMTYAEVVFRILFLCTIEKPYFSSTQVAESGSSQSNANQATKIHWVHPDYKKLLIDFCNRIQDRFSSYLSQRKIATPLPVFSPLPLSSSTPTSSLSSNAFPADIKSLSIEACLDLDPHGYLAQLVTLQCPDASRQLLCNEDVDYFLSLCRLRGRKPVNFIPVIDGELSYWFKKDSLWQSENMDAIPDGDVQRIAILQGPLAVRYSCQVDQSVGEILAEIHGGWVQAAMLKMSANTTIPNVSNLVMIPLDHQGERRLDHTGSLSYISSHRESIQSVYRCIVSASCEYHSAPITPAAISLSTQAPLDTQYAPGDSSFDPHVVEMIAILSLTLTQQSDKLSDRLSWFHWLALHQGSGDARWWADFLHASHLTLGIKHQQNTIQTLFEPRPGQIITFIYKTHSASSSTLPLAHSSWHESIPIGMTPIKTQNWELVRVQINIDPSKKHVVHSSTKLTSLNTASIQPHHQDSPHHHDVENPNLEIAAAISPPHQLVPLVELSFVSSTSRIQLTLLYHQSLRHTESTSTQQPKPLTFWYAYKPELGHDCFTELVMDRNNQIKSFYQSLWSQQPIKARHDSPCQDPLALLQQIHQNSASPNQPHGILDQLEALAYDHEYELRRDEIVAFAQSIGRRLETQHIDPTLSHLPSTSHSLPTISSSIGKSLKLVSESRLVAPIDFSIVISWKSLVRALFCDSLDYNLLQLVHLSHRVTTGKDTGLMLEGEKLITQAQLAAIRNTPHGPSLIVRGSITRSSLDSQSSSADVAATLFPSCLVQPAALMEFESEFLFRSLIPSTLVFSKVEQLRLLILETSTQLSVLKDKHWIQWLDKQDTNVKVGDQLLFRIQSIDSKSTDPKSSILSRVETRGVILKRLPAALAASEEGQVIAHIFYHHQILYPSPSDSPSLSTHSAKEVSNHRCIVSAFLSRWSKPLHPAHPLAKPYLMAIPDRIKAPLENQTYAEVSGDYNPIHTHPYFAMMSQLPASTITHGMWTYANARRVVELSAANGDATRIRSFKAEFLDKVLPGSTLETRVEHVGIQDGDLLVDVITTAYPPPGSSWKSQVDASTSQDTSVVVLKAHAQVAAPKTAYVFTGQGSAEVGMGMDLYAKSSIAKQIWDTADQLFFSKYGISILNIVRNNPKKLDIYFGGKVGAKIRQHYLTLKKHIVGTPTDSSSSTNLSSSSSNARHPAARQASTDFLHMDETTSKITFQHPDGLLFATQFSQPTLVLLEMAAFRTMNDGGFVPENTILAGHSLGEYAALTAVGSIMDIEDLVDVLFLRGMTMQYAVKRDIQGRSLFAMLAVNPSRVHPKALREPQLNHLIAGIFSQRPHLIQIVNYNVENYQYVIAGDRGSLLVLTLVLNALSKNFQANWEQLDKLILDSIQQAESMASHATPDHHDHHSNQQLQNSSSANNGPSSSETSINEHQPSRSVYTYYPLERGHATIVLPGIDVPFHSHHLQDGVPPFRKILLQRLHKEKLNPASLIGRYIPNLVAKPFALNYDFVQLVHQQTQSPILGQWLQRLTPQDMTAVLPKTAIPGYHGSKASSTQLSVLESEQLTYDLLIELLAHQFASPVRWIETQNIFFSEMGIERLIEVGPAPTLFTMAKRTLDLGKYSLLVKRQILWYGKDQAEIYYQLEDVRIDLKPKEVNSIDSNRKLTSAKTTDAKSINNNSKLTVSTSPVSALTIAKPEAPIPVFHDKDMLNSLDFILVLLAVRLKKPLELLVTSSGTTTLKALVSGKSALQNELVGDLEAEFGSSFQAVSEQVTRGDGLTLREMANKIPSYTSLGKVGKQLVQKLITQWMPGGYGLSLVRQYLSQTYQLDTRIQDRILLQQVAISATVNPNGVRITKQEEAEQELDLMVREFAKRNGIVLNKPQQHDQFSIPAQSEQLGPISSSSSAAIIPDLPISSLWILRIILAIKTRQSLDQVPADSTIKSLVSGKSALQNEIIGDLQKEFGIEPSIQALESSLSQLATELRYSNTDGFSTGPYINHMVSKWVHTTMPGGFTLSEIKNYLKDQYCLGPGHVSSILALGCVNHQLQSTIDQVHCWLDGLVQTYAQAQQLVLSKMSSHKNSSNVNSMMVSGTALKTFESKHLKLIQAQFCTLQQYLGQDPIASERLRALEESLKQDRERQLKSWTLEYGGNEDFFQGIQPLFDSNKERRYNSTWNWNRQDCLQLYYDYACGRATQWTLDIRERLYHIKNRASPSLVDMVQYYLIKAINDGHAEIREFINTLVNTLKCVMGEPPRYRELKPSTKPTLLIDPTGKIQYSESLRQGITDMTQYVLEVQHHIHDADTSTNHSPWIHLSYAANNLSAESSSLDQPSPSNCYIQVLKDIALHGLSLLDKTALVTGCGRGSIGLELVKALLRAGVHVYATTSHFNADSSTFYRQLFENNGSKQSELIVLPFNQASVQDIHSLVSYLYDQQGVSLDYLIPFAAISEVGRDIGNLDARSELAHRIMLTNVLRLIGTIKEKSIQDSRSTRPIHILLPLSPNHGVFGSDGLYAESKLGLEALLSKWHSEDWGDYVSLVGAVIGWTRGTNLMAQNDIVAPHIEQLGARTFSIQEMCFNLMGLLDPRVVALAQYSPLRCDLTGSLNSISNLDIILRELRLSIQTESQLKKSVEEDQHSDQTDQLGLGIVTQMATDAAKMTKSIDEAKTMIPSLLSGNNAPTPLLQRANLTIPFPSIPHPSKDMEFAKLCQDLQDVLDLDQVVVVVGFGEIGPFGSARTRWEIEAEGEFSLEGCIELAWLMGFIEYRPLDLSAVSNASASSQASSTGNWIDKRNGERFHDYQIKERYEHEILDHTGIRMIEPSLFDGYDPQRKQFLHQVALNQDLEPIEVSKEEAIAFEKRHGDAVNIYQRRDDGVWFVQLKCGAQLYIPKVMPFNRFVAGQIPTTWDAVRLGFPQDLANQVDRVTQFTLAATMESLVSAGLIDPYELYSHIHVSQVGNAIGGGFGGMQSMRDIYRSRFMEESAQGDVLQETFINTPAAWINMLLMSSAGPIKTPVGACGTAIESLEIGLDTIRSGRAKICLVGGYDDFGEEGSFEFANMKATADSAAELSMGRTPQEISRPATSTRAGFVESQGAGVQILATASLAIEMGLPIYAIIEHVQTAMDKTGRSVPAPGKGILTTCKESKLPSRYDDQPQTPVILDPQYRIQQLRQELQHLDAECNISSSRSTPPCSTMTTLNQLSERVEDTKTTWSLSQEEQQLEYDRRRRMIYATWSHDFYRDHPYISPLRGALSVYHLTVDDIAVSSFHGTGTRGNDLNESQVLQRQLEHLGRAKGNVMLSIFQKYLTGHPKGAAAAWMLNGLIQSILSGIVPGNRNADNIDPQLEAMDRIVYLNRSLHTYGYKAALLKSFGFGQVGGEVLLVHPNHVLAQLSNTQLMQYEQRRSQRYNAAYRHWQDTLTNRSKFIRIKEVPPFTPAQEQDIYLDALARTTYDEQGQEWQFKSNPSKSTSHLPSSLTSQQSTSSTHVRQRGSGEMIGQDGMPFASSQPLSNSAHLLAYWPSLFQSQPISFSAFRRALPETSLTQIKVMMREMGEGLRTDGDRGIGVDAQLISEIEACIGNSEDFVSRNFTPAEIAYCYAAPDPASSFTGRWSAKEAVMKAISSCSMDQDTEEWWKGAGAPLRDIEILASKSGGPIVVLHNEASKIANLLSISTIKASISHSGEYAIAQAIAR